jgi:6,7-dimethyl-8-ribityllumazine synthase
VSTADAVPAAAPHLDGPAPHVLIVRAPYYRDVVDGLTRGAERVLREARATFETLDVAQAIRIAVRGDARFNGFVALGCIVRGETDHYEHLCRETMAGMMAVALQFGLAVGTGLLTVDTVEQALARSDRNGHNKGAEAAVAALLQIAAARRLAAS